MNTLPCQDCKGLCCGPVPITEKERKHIHKKLKAMPKKLRENLEQQPRFSGTCIFYDMNKDQCGIHSFRPEICRMFGYHEDLVCFRKPELATKGKVAIKERYIGHLSIDFTWKDFR
ncbi:MULTISPECIES: YkgJ family cysteine cluster protein [Brevibacillus]|uniref:YkgJ family cysteine cluster protein n=2 Tax=Brevibacillus agri TaxID=51101 RepID=A0A3M8AZV4_9BACL|nr:MULTISPECIES: YkgJ family cysteine cluster protein [Brevibacillus]EJL44047.1 putative Fe-S oxidoreductase [Brevibacillus sp. CF112]MBY0053058.1 YkgJ family cysteine cluster protein [Brevibacillus agri]MCG5253271.1 YkgJ family cysteine cluster protein [Brevibacillus agri]MDN4092196.1 YkgJ family cysteine cluster protein [Brevibacillus agri]MDR9507269.1 YkgJ family cysteine cluster protein [Brevibacillus agri]